MFETHAVWRHTEENVKGILTDAEMRVKHMYCDSIQRKTQKSSQPMQRRLWTTCIVTPYLENAKVVLTDDETRMKHMHCDAIIEYQEKRKRRHNWCRSACETHAFWCQT